MMLFRAESSESKGFDDHILHKINYVTFTVKVVTRIYPFLIGIFFLYVGIYLN